MLLCLNVYIELSWCLVPNCREKLDQIYDSYSVTFTLFMLWDWLYSEHNCNILWVSSSHSLWYYGSCLCHLGLHFLPPGSSWYCFWEKLEWRSKQSMPCQDHTSAYSRKEVVSDTICSFLDGRIAAIWKHIY